MSKRVISWQKRAFYYLLRFVLRPFFGILYGTRYFGQSNMPEDGPVVVVSNHQSHFDPPLIGGGLSRRLNYLARKSLFKSKFFAGLIRALDAIPLETDGIGFEGIKESLKRLRNDEMILIFPEGARTWDGNIAPFLPGALTLAQRSKATILPTAIHGCFDTWPRTQKYPRLWGNFRVIFGKPLYYDEFKDLTENELEALVEKQIHSLFEKIRHNPNPF
ncbi:MAG: lysophospholipid acyltransferase family protein [Thermoguttaceae bacterium]